MTSLDVAAWRAELREVMGSYEFAWAFGHGCSLGDHPRFAATRQRVADLQALIQEHEVREG